MDIIQLLTTRRSIRKYKETSLDNALVSSLIQAAMYAPSARNTRCWEFLVIDKKEKLLALSKLHPHASMLSTAPAAILVAADVKAEPIAEYAAINCSAATQNLLLAAHGCGLGAVWLGIYPRPERMQMIKDFCKLPEHIMPVSLIAVGYTDEQPRQPERYEPQKIKYNSWNNDI